MKQFFSLLTAYCLLPSALFSQTWNALGTGGSGGLVYALKEWNNNLYIGGGFEVNNVQYYDGICSFNGTNFDSLDSGLYGSALTFTEYNNILYVGGKIISASGVPNTARVAAWDGNVWLTGGNFADFSQVNALAVYKGELYAGGNFYDMGGNPSADKIAKWNGTSWSGVGAPMIGNQTVECMAVYNGELYVGGNVGLPGGPNNYYYQLVRWNGTKWDSVGGKFGGGYVMSLCVDTINNVLYAGGGITYAGTIPIWSVAKWDGVNLSSPGGFGITDGALSMCMFNNEFYVGGTGWSDTTLAKYNGVNWTPIIPAPNSTVQALAVYDGNLYVGGWFTKVGTINANYIACYGNNCPQGVGITEFIVQNLKFKVYPNPAKAEININVEEKEHKEYIARVYNSVGAKIAEQKFIKQTRISTTGFSKGIYQVQVCNRDGGICHTEKIILK